MGVVTTVHALRGDISTAIDYILDENKTERILTGCSDFPEPASAGYVWKIKNNANVVQNGGRNRNEGVVGFHFIQSFDDPSILPEQCYQLAQEWIDKCTGGEYDYVIAVHKNTRHIHAHIIVNGFSNKTNKKWDIFFKRDLPRFKKFNNDICKKYGVDVFENDKTVGGKSWYYQHHKNVGDNYDIVIKKSLDYLINKVQSYEQLKQYLTNIGYVVEDGSEASEENKKVTKDILENYAFTVNRKMINEELSNEYFYFVRIPYSQNWMQIPTENVKWNDKETVLNCQMNLNDTFILMDKDGTVIDDNAEGVLIADSFESKNKDKLGRQGLRIKPPTSKKFRRCSNIKDEEHPEVSYKLEDVVKRIENNNVSELDENIEKVLNLSNSDEKTIRKEKNNFYEKAEIKTNYNQSDFYKMSGYDKFLYFKSKEIQSTLDQMANDDKLVNDILNYDKLNTLDNKLRHSLNDINKKLREENEKLKDFQGQVMEGIISADDNIINDWVQINVQPLRDEKRLLTVQSHEVKERLKAVERNKDRFK